MTAGVPESPSALPLPMFWPVMAVSALFESGLEFAAHNLKYLTEEAKLNNSPPPQLATPSTTLLNLRTLVLRDYGPGRVRARHSCRRSYAGHTAVIADYADGQSLVQTLRANGLDRVVLTDW